MSKEKESNEQSRQNGLNEHNEEQERPLTREELYDDYMLRFTGQKAKNWHAIYRAMKLLATKLPEDEFESADRDAELIIEEHKFYEVIMNSVGFTRENSPELYKAFDKKGNKYVNRKSACIRQALLHYNFMTAD